MLAAPLNARIQAAVAPHSICGRSVLRPLPFKQIHTLRTRIGLTSAQGSSSALATAGTPQRPFYNRVGEKRMFKDQLSGEPGVITVLIGPPNCGKTRFLQELAGQLELGATPPPVIYINSRLISVDGPEEVSKALSHEVTSVLSKIAAKFPELFQAILKTVSVAFGGNLAAGAKMAEKALGVGDGDVEVDLNITNLANFIRKDEGSLTETIKKLTTLFAALNSLPIKPVLVIDEANKLMDWKEPESSQPQLSKLLSFLVSISKEANLVHVILATSDYFLAAWLSQQGLTEDKFAVEVLGDLTEEEAREFVLGDGAIGEWHGIINYPSLPVPVPPGAEEQWPAIYERCGGNIGLLGQCVLQARSKGNWDDALQTVVAGPHEAVVRGLEPEVYIKKGGEAPLWTKDQWKRVLESITTAPHHAVSVSTIKEELENAGEGNGSNILLSMVKYNLLALRPFSTLARDLPREVHGNRKRAVVTLPLPAHVWAAKDVLEELKEAEAKGSDLQR